MFQKLRKITRYLSCLLTIWAVFACLIVPEGRIFAQIVKKPVTGSPTKKTTAPPDAGDQASVTIGDVSTQPRYALVIGNSAYPGEMHLTNPISDSAAISRSLRTLKFNVTEKNNLARAEMRAAVEDFSRKLPADAVAVFYFAGHGLQVSGRNFLLPVDFKEIKSESDLLATQIDLDYIVEALTRKSGLSIVILDACRNNEIELALTFKSESGFAVPKQNSGGVYIAYSTSPGKKASDGTGSNSPYAKALSQNLLLNPGRLEDIFIKTRIDVRNQTIGDQEGEQIPWESGSLSKLFYFTPDKRGNLNLKVNSPAVLTAAKPALPLGINQLLSFAFDVPLLDRRGAKIKLENKTGRFFVEKQMTSNLEMVEIPGGKFQMGSSFEEVDEAYEDALKSNDTADREIITAEMPRRTVEVPGFFMSKYEITQKQWREVMTDLPEIPADLLGDEKPIVNISWEEANRFCDRLSTRTHHNYRLPSEAEWEFAARAGTDTPFAFGQNISSSYVNFFAYVPFGEGLKGEYREKTTAAGQIQAANNFGLFDMEGNVSEWCADYWHWDYNGAPSDGSAWNEPAKIRPDDADDPANYRVIRGCAFDSIGNDCRSAHRRAKPATGEFKLSDLGFRVVLAK